MAAVGVSISAFNLVSKLFNVPLLNITTSFVAEEQALVGDNENNSLKVDTSINSVQMFSLQRHVDSIVEKLIMVVIKKKKEKRELVMVYVPMWSISNYPSDSTAESDSTSVIFGQGF